MTHGAGTAVRTRRRRWFWANVGLCLAVLALAGALVLAAWVGSPLDPAPYLRVAASGELLDRDGRLLYAVLASDEQWRFPRPLEAMSPYLVQATLAAEDQRFYAHPGVDPVAVARAALQNVSGGEVVSGASTLTMQVVKQTDGPVAGLPGKFRQAVQALRLERAADKDAVLEAYLNCAPYGMNLVGCEAASRRYFGKPASELTLPEAALLAGLPKAPSALMPIEHPERARARRDYVLARMLADGHIGAAAYNRAVAAPLGVRWHAFPKAAPHVAQRLGAAGTTVQTTLDAAVQQRAARLLREAVRGFNGTVTNGAVLVADVPSGEVLAHVGSFDFFDTPGGGQVDAVRAARSPGSALKPFIYALAIERGRVYPSEVFLDGSIDYGRYSPGNFDGEYRGLVSATEALRDSLNVPAVALLERVGVDATIAWLESAGLSTLARPARDYGLGFALGDGEVRLDELAAAYRAVAAMGTWRPLLYRMGTDSADETRLLRPDTCAALYAMLEQPFPHEYDTAAAPSPAIRPRVCWKTGTSSGRRDAWAIVFNARYLVAVWMGNNSGAPAHALVGAHAALPLAARVFRSLPGDAGGQWPDTSGLHADGTVCASTGLPASDWCPVTRTAWFPRGAFLNRACGVHGPGGDGTVAERWPARAAGWDLAKVVAPAVQQARASRDTALRIQAPADGAAYLLTGEPSGDRIRLEASWDRESTLHWYLNDRYLGASEPAKPLHLDLSPGAHKLTCLAPNGRTDAIRFEATHAGAARFR